MYRIFILLVLTTAVAPVYFVSGDEYSDQVDEYFVRWDRDDSPGVSVAIVRDGETLYSQAYGMANLEHGVSNTPETIFHVASVSKQFTAFAIFLLEQDKKLSLEDDIRKYLPELPEFKGEIRIRHLVHHTSGLRDQWDLLVLAGWRMDDVITHTDVLELVKSQRDLNFLPGERYLYCNTGYTLLAEIVERVAGSSLREFCRERIFVPLEMDNTHFHDDHRQIVPGRSDGYWPKRDGWQKAVLSYAVVGATSLLTTTEDLAKWQRNFEVKKLGSPTTHENMVERAELNGGKKISYAGGVYHGEVSGHPTIGHSGGDAGYVCHVERFTDENLSVIVLANTNNVPVARLSHQVGLIYLGENEKDVNASLAVSTALRESQFKESKPWLTASLSKTSVGQSNHAADVKIEDRVGRYFSPELEISYEVVLDNGQLHLKRRKFGTQRCRKTGENTYRVSSGVPMEIKFRKDADGKISGLEVSTGRVNNLEFLKRD